MSLLSMIIATLGHPANSGGTGGGGGGTTSLFGTPAVLLVELGESGSRGRAPNSFAAGAETTDRTGLSMLNNNSNVFEPYNINTNNDTGNPDSVANWTGLHGIGLGLANIQEAGGFSTQPKIYMAGTGQGGSLIENWANNCRDLNTAPGGQPASETDCFNTAVDRIRLAIDLLTELRGVAPQIFIVFNQGLNNIYGTSFTGAAWEPKAKRVINSLRSVFGNLPIILTEFFVNPTSGNDYTRFNTNMDDMAATMPGIHTVSTNGLQLTDELHLGYQGNKDYAQHIVTAIKASYTLDAPVGATPNTSAPTIVSKTVRWKDRLRIEFSKVVTGVSAANFSVTLNGTSNAITSVKGAGTVYYLLLTNAIAAGDTVALSYSGTAVADTGSRPLAAFSGAAVTNGLENYQALPMTTTDYTQGPTGTWTPNVVDTTYNHQMKSTLKLAAGTEGSLCCDVDAATDVDGSGYFLGFNTSNAYSTVSNMPVSLRPAVTSGIWQVYLTGANQATVFGQFKCNNGDKTRARRVNESGSWKIYLEKLPFDGLGWATMHTVDDPSSGGDLWGVITGYGNVTLKNVKHIGFA